MAGDERASPDGAEESDGDEAMPPFVRYGLLTVVVYGVVVAALAAVSSVDIGGPTLVAFTVGFLVFMTVYFASMWFGYLLLDSPRR